MKHISRSRTALLYLIIRVCVAALDFNIAESHYKIFADKQKVDALLPACFVDTK